MEVPKHNTIFHRFIDIHVKTFAHSISISKFVTKEGAKKKHPSSNHFLKLPKMGRVYMEAIISKNYPPHVHHYNKQG